MGVSVVQERPTSVARNMLLRKKRLDADASEELIRKLQRRELGDADYASLIKALTYGVCPLEILRRQRTADAGEEGAEKDKGKEAKPKDGKGSEAAKKPKGHGRLGSADYTGARNRTVLHDTRTIGESCPCCGRGHLYEMTPLELINLVGSAPVEAIRYLRQRLRCSACQGVFKADLPEGASPEKCQPSANASVVLMKFAMGVPFKRLEKWQNLFGVPLPDATQFDMSEKVADHLLWIFKMLEVFGAGSDLFHIDDTGMPVLSLIEENKGLKDGDRYGMNATGILAYHEGHPIYLYYVGRDHAGENLGRLLEKRDPDLKPPIQMGDASSRNTKHDHQTVPIFCASHAVRQFKDCRDAFPWECDLILDLLGKVFKNDSKTKAMTDEQRLAY